jgi:hypothetical protein
MHVAEVAAGQREPRRRRAGGEQQLRVADPLTAVELDLVGGAVQARDSLSE